MMLFSAYILCMTVASLAASGRLRSYEALVCRTPRSDLEGLWGAWYWSKCIEWIDTAILIASGRKVSWLHYNHHLTTAAMVALQSVGRRVRTPLSDVGMVLNSAVHVVMYAYYLDPSRFSRAARRCLTTAQTVQHATMAGLAVHVVWFLRPLPRRCDVPWLPYAVAAALYGLYLVQFTLFLVRDDAATGSRDPNARGWKLV